MYKLLKNHIWSVVLCILCILAIGILMSYHRNNINAMRTLQRYNTQEEQYQNAENTKENDLKQKFFSNSLHSKDTKIREEAINVYDNNISFEPIQQFFTIYYNFNSNKDYSARPHKLTQITSPNILNNSKIFGSGKDSSGGNYIDNSQEHSRYKSLNTTILNYGQRYLKIIADVQYQSWYSGNRPETGEKFYLMTYDTQAKQIIGMKTLYKTKNISDNTI